MGPKLTVLVSGGAGYIGSVLVPRLLELGHRVRVVDRFFFGDHFDSARRNHGERLQIWRADVRSPKEEAFEGVDAVIDLAAISNDPSCELDPKLTRSINHDGALKTLELAHGKGVSRYILSSSCSVYGRGEHLGLTETTEPQPISLYARCKVQVEQALRGYASKGFCPVILRLSTVFGPSPRMRFDLAVNVMTKNAYVNREITVDGGGQQWRPFVHVNDVVETMIYMLTAPAEKVGGQTFNVGHDDLNVQILNLAYRVRNAVEHTQVRVVPTDPDLRTYNVKFDKLKDY